MSKRHCTCPGEMSSVKTSKPKIKTFLKDLNEITTTNDGQKTLEVTTTSYDRGKQELNDKYILRTIPIKGDGNQMAYKDTVRGIRVRLKELRKMKRKEHLMKKNWKS